MKFAFFALALLAASSASAEVVRSKLYEIDKVEGAPLFTQESKIEPAKDGTTKSISSIKDAEGKTVMTEEVVLKGTSVISQKVEQLQTNETYELAREGKELVFRTFEKGEDGKLKLKEEKKQEEPENFITGPATNSYLLKNWEALRSGKTVEANFGVFEISKSVGFEFSWQGKKKDLVTIKMKPSSTLISFFVSPIFLYFNDSGTRLMRFKGRTPLKRKIRGNLKPFDAEILYEYEGAK